MPDLFSELGCAELTDPLAIATRCHPDDSKDRQAVLFRPHWLTGCRRNRSTDPQSLCRQAIRAQYHLIEVRLAGAPMAIIDRSRAYSAHVAYKWPALGRR